MKTIVVTGATRGMGKAIAEKFASQGFAIAFCARNSEEVDNLDKYLRTQYGVQTIPFVCDLAKKDDIQAFTNEIKTKWAGIHVLVNSAGMFIPGQIMGEEEGVYEKLMAVNAAAPYYIVRGLQNLLLNTPQSHIFTICSTASIVAGVNGGSYCISKHAVLGLTKSLREELKDKNIKVTAVLPGSTFTSSWDGSGVDPDRLVTADDIANAVWAAYNTAPSTVVEEVLIRPQLGDW